jgi:serine/threonine-protein kinase
MVGKALADRYELTEKLASGGMGTVFVATDTRLQRRVALKLLKEDLASDPRFVERFRREARAAGALSHPNVAGVFDYGEDEGRHFIVMELVEGRDLGRLLREEGPLSEERAALIAGQIADALEHSHAAGLVHRDIKPENVIVGPTDRVKVTDFGIVRAQAETSLTATGSFLGTAQYISPEQASGADVTPASDIYSLGIVLFEMLTGSVPYTGDSAVAVAMRHISDRVPAPSSLRPEISKRMDDVVARATAPDMHDRFRDAAAVSAALQGAPVATPTSASTQVMSVGAGSTAVLGGGRATEVDSEWPFPAHPPAWDTRRLGRIVLGIFLVLLLLAAGLLLYRLNEAGDRREARARGGGGAEQQAAPTTEEVVENELPDLIGRSYEEAAAELEEMGLGHAREDAENEDYEAGLVFATEPGPGSTVSEGDTVTLFVSSGPPQEAEPTEEDLVPGEDESFVPPGQAKKDDKDDEEEDD